jgi:hypothetical protein
MTCCIGFVARWNVFRSEDTFKCIQTAVVIGAYHFCQLRTKFLSNFLLSRLTPYAKEIIRDQCGF